MCFGRTMWRLVQSSMLAETVVASIVLQPFLCQMAMASRMPCNVTSPASDKDTIECVQYEDGSGHCDGSWIISLEQSACGDTDEPPCPNAAQYLTSQYRWKSTYLGWMQWLDCLPPSADLCAAIMLQFSHPRHVLPPEV
jgi:hypothetical protein